jgi:hypothetical protein
MWKPFFNRNNLPYVTPHSARHSYISILQMQGVEVGLVAKIAGHANPNVTLGHYTQAVRGGAEAAAALERAFEPRVRSATSSRKSAIFDCADAETRTLSSPTPRPSEPENSVPLVVFSPNPFIGETVNY